MEKIKFSKYHGIGNDFVLIADPDDRLRLSNDQVRYLCDRHFGIGADGVIRVAPGSEAEDVFMDYVNSDGSIGEMCGNGIRCLALFARSEGLVSSERLVVGTRAGTKVVEIAGDGRVRVDMGPPVFEPSLVPVAWDGQDALHAKIELESEVLEGAVLSMGNPHAVLFVEDPAISAVTTLGPAVERHPMFPNGTNVEFAHVERPDRVRMRVWERGSGETLACGTGAAAVGVAARLLAGTDEVATISLPGGDLEVEWGGSTSEEEPVFMTGPATRVFEGEIEL